jgi:hypothetical protein
LGSKTPFTCATICHVPADGIGAVITVVAVLLLVPVIAKDSAVA